MKTIQFALGNTERIQNLTDATKKTSKIKDAGSATTSHTTRSAATA